MGLFTGQNKSHQYLLCEERLSQPGLQRLSAAVSHAVSVQLAALHAAHIQPPAAVSLRHCPSHLDSVSNPVLRDSSGETFYVSNFVKTTPCLNKHLIKGLKLISNLRLHAGCMFTAGSICSSQAPFPNSGFVNGFGTAAHYKTGSNSLNIGRPFNRNRFVILFFVSIIQHE